MDQNLIDVFALSKKDIKRFFRTHRDIKNAIGISPEKLLKQIREAMYVSARRSEIKGKYQEFIDAKFSDAEYETDEVRKQMLYSAIEQAELELGLVDATNPYPAEFDVFAAAYISFIEGIVPADQEIIAQ